MTHLDTAPHIRRNVALVLMPDDAGDCAPDTAAFVTAHDKVDVKADDPPEVALDATEASGTTEATDAALSLDDLESRMCLLAGRIAANECEFLTLLAEYDEREGWVCGSSAPPLTGCPPGAACASALRESGSGSPAP
jgi:hypothetical protein